MPIDSGKKQSIYALEATNFFLADVQTGLGPFLAAYLAGTGWAPGRIGMALTVSGIITVVLQTPAGAIVDRLRSKRLILLLASAVLAIGAILLSNTTEPWAVYTSQVLIGGAGPFLAPTLAAITMGMVGVTLFDRQFGKNQSFNSAGNVACAVLIAGMSHWFGNRAIFLTAAVLTIPTAIAITSIKGEDIDHDLARGCAVKGDGKEASAQVSIVKVLLGDKVLLVFLGCAFLFHFANAAMLPQLGEMLSNGAQATAAPFMSACIIVTQIVIMCSAPAIGRFANMRGRKPLLLVGFGVLPIRALLYTLTHNTGGLIAIQLLDGVANAVFGVVSVLVIADRTRGTGRFNLVQGSLATAVGLGAALSTTFGGKLIQHFSYRISFLSLGAIAAFAFVLLWMAIPETLPRDNQQDQDISNAISSQELSA
ncbi:arabinose efflux permease family protein [Terriglobus roseus DSM 18391]|uniref:Arabinose efflux permease family protein n=1 Tax=Terriglobus roseus (strain DSM 18391 / NRRL B-41598 / KBS 63) TaxID=926566 RepID=I3ZFF5_TERRK|nr:MFS transporter [Terriglobus roseus]AFL87973.1 arabinose efflux permease family protein [Terriglobus roseus DSM 18391]